MWVITNNGHMVNLDNAVAVYTSYLGTKWSLEAEMVNDSRDAILVSLHETECLYELSKIGVALAAGVTVYEVGKGAVVVERKWDAVGCLTDGIEQCEHEPIILLDEVQNG